MEITGERFIPGSWDEVEAEHFNRYYFVVNQLDLSNKSVLDLACGEGYGSNLLAIRAKNVIGIDINQETVEHAKAKYKKSNLIFLVGSAINIPLPNNSVDVFVSFETIEHHAEHKLMFSEIVRILKKDGVLLISSPDKLNYSDTPHYQNPYHIKELYYNEFKSLIKENFHLSYFFSQKFFIGSIIAFDDTYNYYEKPIIVEKDGSANGLTPMYNIAIATNDSNFKLKHLMVFYKEKDHLISKADWQVEINNAQNLVYKSLSYRLGFFFVGPIKRIIKILIKK